MRNLFIRFKEEGELLRELEENRFYFLCEAEENVQKVRKRLSREKRMAEPKAFECWIDGKQLVITQVFFEKEQSLEKQLETTILNFEGWEEEIRHKYANKLREYADLERQLFLNKEFQSFAIRMDQILGRSDVTPFPLLLDIQQLKQLFDGFYVHVSNGFFSELEEIVNTLKAAYRAVINKVLLDNESQKNDLKDAVLGWLSIESHFQEFIQYATANYRSIPKTRLEALFIRFLPYQKIESHLFTDYAEEQGFEKAYDLHVNLVYELSKKYDEILFTGFVLDTNEVIESLVFSPVISSYWKKVRDIDGSEQKSHLSEH
ncbi:hypothetical protein [Pseudobacillus badius]|uniref:hypothetical protein n=1 Tax=Bacillus badius TaxID=1455 RepID=UPI0007B06E9A|nr:hypothetical protein [Bacillus badius]KZO00917.1 hypothetical protein A4244_14470 [Bacillus badius]OCS88880.1 hypothetical protein A6M11_14490 [Bacillus badius]OVE47546.1 hypothetical protein B1A98_18455 [Bacillus badius]TDV99664.1 hypothetical protein B0G66_12124 [Bacillus badius]